MPTNTTPRRATRLIGATALIATGFACGANPGSHQHATTPPDTKEASADARPPRARPVDPGPTLARVSGGLPVQTLEPARVKASGAQLTSDALYISYVQPTPLRTYVYTPPSSDRIEAVRRDGVPYVAAFDAGHAEGGREVLLRLARTPKGRIPSHLDLHRTTNTSMIYGPPTGPSVQHVVLEEIDVAVKKKTRTKDRTLEASFYEAAAQSLSLPFFSGDPTFAAFARERLKAIATRSSKARAATAPRPAFTRRDDLMELYSGMTSVEEALQRDRSLLIRGDREEKRVIDISEVVGLSIDRHPWDAMIAELGAKPVIEPLAKSIPHDMLYIHFDDIRDMLAVIGDVETLIGPLASAMENKTGTSHIARRYQTQLAVGRSKLSEHFGHLAVSAVAITLSDPYVREGTDLTIAFQVKDARLLDGALAQHEASVRERRPDLKRETFRVGSFEGALLSTPDGAVRQHRLALGELLLISNSRVALERYVAVHEGKAKPIASRGDFRYMRARYPYGPKTESGFIFIGDDFVERINSPTVKILEARRMYANAELRAVTYGALLFGWIHGRAPKDIDEVVASGILEAAHLTHLDGGAIAFDLERGASSAWGTSQHLMPLLERDVGKVSVPERDAYARFKRGYESYWQEFIDPIAVQIVRSKDGDLSFDARMLPLIERSAYDEIIAQVGEQQMTPPAPSEGLMWAMAIGKDAQLRQMLNGVARDFTGDRDIKLDWVGDFVYVGCSDNSALWDVAMALGEIPTLGQVEHLGSIAGMVTILQKLPLYVGVHVGSKFTLAATLAGARRYIDTSTGGLLEFVASEPYRGVPITTIREKANPGSRPELGGIALHYAIPGDVLVLSLSMDTMLDQIDAVLDGRVPDTSTLADKGASERGAMQTFLVANPGDGESWLRKTLAARMEKDIMRNAFDSHATIRLLERGWAEPNISGEPVTYGERFGDKAMAYLGYEPRSAHGSTITIDRHGRLTDSVYGLESTPRLPELPVPGSPFYQAINTLERLEMGLGFEGDAKSRGLHVKISVNRR